MDGKTHDPFIEGGVAQTTFKIDCETPGATVQYSIKTLNTKDDSNTLKSLKDLEEKPLPAGIGDNKGTTITIDDLKSNNFSPNMTDATMQNGTSSKIGIGERNSLISEKIYIKAVAQKSYMKDSAEGKEGAFKTVIHYYFSKNRQNGDDWSGAPNGNTSKNKELIEQLKQLGSSIKTPLRIHGAQLPEGSSYTAGWPLTQNGNYRRDYQIAFTDGKDRHFYWVSWQVLSDFNLQTYSVDFQRPANPDATYGMYYYCNDPDYWGDFDRGHRIIINN